MSRATDGAVPHSLDSSCLVVALGFDEWQSIVSIGRPGLERESGVWPPWREGEKSISYRNRAVQPAGLVDRQTDLHGEDAPDRIPLYKHTYMRVCVIVNGSGSNVDCELTFAIAISYLD